ncbi:Peptidyl-prolyl cis-trans isomerase FKBP17-1 [Cardamine amara subsp. amara]|uniref:peptidylprolyl isomerase n=1 Tax=Cardamine amara subsp. amara TaxID=228776 RepID=A0ABD1AFN4_CARAN
MIRCFAWTRVPFITSVCFTSPPSIRIFASHSCASSSSPPPSSSSSSSVAASRRSISLSIITATSLVISSVCLSSPALAEFSEIPNSGGVKSLDLRIGDGEVPIEGDQIAIHYYGRLAAKQGWRFDSTYDHKDNNGEAVPFTFILGSNKVIRGIETAVRTMKVGGIRRVIIPPSQGYQNTSQEPLPPNFFDRQRLFTTIFNPTRLANGEGSTLGTLVFDIELVSTRRLQR